MGCIAEGADDEKISLADSYGSKLGLAFQIQDDILDVTSSLEVLGKPIGSDARNEKATYVAFEGLEKAGEEVERLSREAVAILDGFKREHTFLRELFMYLIHRER